MKYILNAIGEPVAEPNLYKWASWFETSDRAVARDHVCGAIVSTVFLGLVIDESCDVWETMVFGQGHIMDEQQDRCGGSREQALAMHAKMVEAVKKYPVTTP